MNDTRTEERYREIHAKLPPSGMLDIPPVAGTWDGFMDWATSDMFPEKRRIDFLGGRLHLDFGPEDLVSHNLSKGALLTALGTFARDFDLGEVLGSFCRYGSRDADVATQPDVFLSTFDSLRSERVRYVERVPGSGEYYSVQGNLDLIAEVVGYDTETHDTRDLPPFYFAAGVRELWLADTRDSGMKFRLLTRGTCDWFDVPPDAEDFRRSAVLGRRVRIDRITDRVGLPDFDVLIRE